jgi:TRAP-type C4-dicarboxylate transport system permease large subunit
MVLIALASGFGYVMTLMQIPLKITQGLTSFTQSPGPHPALHQRDAADLGTLMDMAALIVILTPILLPVAIAIGVDPVHFGMIMIVNLGIGLITPPVGTVLFVGSAVAKLPIEQVVKALMPFFVLLLIVLGFITYVPALSLWLPRAMGL